MQVYHREHTGRPLRVLWTLEELGQPYEFELMTYEQGKSEEHLARHPLGRVPVIDDGEGYVFESAAICLQLADLYPEGAMMPPLGTHERALVYQWSVFAPSELEPHVMEAAIFEATPTPSGRPRGGALQQGGRRRRTLARRRSYLVGDGLTVADVMVSTALNFANRAGFGEVLGDTVKTYIGAPPGAPRVPARPRARLAAPRRGRVDRAKKRFRTPVRGNRPGSRNGSLGGTSRPVRQKLHPQGSKYMTDRLCSGSRFSSRRRRSFARSR